MNHSHAKKTQHNTASLAAPCSPQPQSLRAPQLPPLPPEQPPPAPSGCASPAGSRGPASRRWLAARAAAGTAEPPTGTLTPGTGCPPESSLGRREPLGGREPLGDSVLCKAQESSESALHRNRTVHATFGDGVQEGCQKLPFFFFGAFGTGCDCAATRERRALPSTATTNVHAQSVCSAPNQAWT